MLLWVILTLMVALAVSGLTFGLVHRVDAGRSRATTTSILAAQLRNIDAQLAQGEVSQREAAPLRTEIRRRILVEGIETETFGRPLAASTLPWLALGIAGVVALAATGLYAMLGQPRLSSARAPATQDAEADNTHPGGDVSAMIAQLEAKMRERPNDAEGWRLLGWSYLSTGRAADAVTAYEHAVALAPQNADYRSSEGEALVRAADGQVTPSALDAFHAALKDDPADPRAKYYLAVYKDQTGDHDGAMADWIALIRSAPAGAPWLPDVRRFVENVARQRGVNIASRLPPDRPAAQQASAGSREPASTGEGQPAAPSAGSDAVIQGMVDRLAGELKANPRNVEGWERLMRSRMVLGQTAAAAVAYRDSLDAFANAPDIQARLRNSARALGVPGGAVVSGK